MRTPGSFFHCGATIVRLRDGKPLNAKKILYRPGGAGSVAALLPNGHVAYSDDWVFKDSWQPLTRRNGRRWFLLTSALWRLGAIDEVTYKELERTHDALAAKREKREKAEEIRELAKRLELALTAAQQRKLDALTKQ